MSDQDFSFFAEAMNDVIPLQKSAPVCVQKNRQTTPGQHYRRLAAQFSEDRQNCHLSLVLSKQLKADDWLSFKRNGIQTGVFKNLRLGKYPLEATLNLFHKTPSQARNDLLEFVKASRECNLRSVLINCGGKKQNLAQIKSYLAQWLPEMEEIQAFHTAQIQHGGYRAVYVLLRKSDQLKQQNRERHAARRNY